MLINVLTTTLNPKPLSKLSPNVYELCFLFSLVSVTFATRILQVFRFSVKKALSYWSSFLNYTCNWVMDGLTNYLSSRIVTIGKAASKLGEFRGRWRPSFLPPATQTPCELKFLWNLNYSLCCPAQAPRIVSQCGTSTGAAPWEECVVRKSNSQLMIWINGCKLQMKWLSLRK